MPIGDSFALPPVVEGYQAPPPPVAPDKPPSLPADALTVSPEAAKKAPQVSLVDDAHAEMTANRAGLLQASGISYAPLGGAKSEWMQQTAKEGDDLGDFTRVYANLFTSASTRHMGGNALAASPGFYGGIMIGLITKGGGSYAHTDFDGTFGTSVDLTSPALNGKLPPGLQGVHLTLDVGHTSTHRGDAFRDPTPHAKQTEGVYTKPIYQVSSEWVGADVALDFQKGPVTGQLYGGGRAYWHVMPETPYQWSAQIGATASVGRFNAAAQAEWIHLGDSSAGERETAGTHVSLDARAGYRFGPHLNAMSAGAFYHGGHSVFGQNAGTTDPAAGLYLGFVPQVNRKKDSPS